MEVRQDANIGIYGREDLKPRRKNKDINKITMDDFTEKSLCDMDIYLFVDVDNQIKILESNV